MRSSRGRGRRLGRSARIGGRVAMIETVGGLELELSRSRGAIIVYTYHDV